MNETETVKAVEQIFRDLITEHGLNHYGTQIDPSLFRAEVKRKYCLRFSDEAIGLIHSGYVPSNVYDEMEARFTELGLEIDCESDAGCLVLEEVKSRDVNL